MLNKDLIFSLLMEDYMGILYIPWLSTQFSEKEETTSLDFTLEKRGTGRAAFKSFPLIKVEGGRLKSYCCLLKAQPKVLFFVTGE